MPNYEIRNGERSWTGKTKKAAEAARDADLGVLFADLQADVPKIITVPPLSNNGDRYLGLVFFRLTGSWSYRILISPAESESTDWRPMAVCDGPWSTSAAMTERACRRHMAQLVCCVSQAGVALPDGLDLLAPDDEDGLREHLRWLAWQVAFARLAARHPLTGRDTLHALTGPGQMFHAEFETLRTEAYSTYKPKAIKESGQ